MAFGRSVINKGPETHSYPVIDLTTKVKMNTHTHSHTHAHIKVGYTGQCS